MKPIPLNAETEQIARSLVWFEPPEEALADPVRFMAYAMARATHEQMRTILRYVTDAEFRQRAPRDYRPSLLGLLEFEARPLSRAALALAPVWVIGLIGRRARSALRPFPRRLSTP